MEASGLGTPTNAHLPPRRFVDDGDNGAGDDGGSRDDDAHLPPRRFEDDGDNGAGDDGASRDDDYGVLGDVKHQQQ